MIVVGYACLGLLVGMMTGLSSSPAANAVLAAIFTLGGGSIVPLLSKPNTERRILGSILAGFSLLCMAGVLGGIYIKVNQKLGASTSEATVYLKSADMNEVNAVNFDYVNKHITPAEAYQKLWDIVNRMSSQRKE